MKITKFDHSGFLLEKDGRGLLFDPVEYEHKLPSFSDIDVIIITHVHSDHFQPAAVARIRSANPEAKIFVTADNTELADVATVVKSGDKVTVGVFELEFYGENHAEIVPGQVPCEDIGVLIDGVFANSGDSFALPPMTPAILLAPLSAPWMKMEETMEFIKAVKPKVVIPTHDGLNSELGNTICDNWVKRACQEVGAEYKNVHFGEVV
jgi:L-ascorbate metabolism protein UlaG (beta-lactamase superfamily)